MRALILLSVLALSGCGTIQPQDLWEAVKIRDNQCGEATIKGNLDVGGTLGFFATTVVVDIEKSKKTYVDAAGNTQNCP